MKRHGFSRKKSLKYPKADEQARVAFDLKIRAYKEEGKFIV
jgi:hypothetical protein